MSNTGTIHLVKIHQKWPTKSSKLSDLALIPTEIVVTEKNDWKKILRIYALEWEFITLPNLTYPPDPSLSKALI